MNTGNDKIIIITARTADSYELVSRLKSLGVEADNTCVKDGSFMISVDGMKSDSSTDSKFYPISIKCSQCYENRETNLIFSFILGIIQKVCRELSVEILRVEYYEEKNRSAILVKADISNIVNDLHFLRELLSITGSRFDITIKVQKEDLFRYMHRI